MLYIIKSSIGLALLIAFYYGFLEKEKTFVFNRFFLLAAVGFSLVVPLIPIGYGFETQPPAVHDLAQVNDSVQYFAPGLFGHSWVKTFGWTVYLAGLTIMGIKFFLGLGHLLIQGSRGEAVIWKGRNLILLDAATAPHSFLGKIYVNKKQFREGNIPEEVMVHEEIHIQQHHSLDILFIEVLQVIFWFNPLFRLFGKAIKLNHEYLADGNVLRLFTDDLKYKKYLVRQVFQNPEDRLVSTFNSSFTKKRLIMMSKQKSPYTATLKQLMLLPLMVLMVFFLSVPASGQSNESPAKKENPPKKEKNGQKEAAVIIPVPPSPPTPPTPPTPEALPVPPAPPSPVMKVPAPPAPPSPPSPVMKVPAPPAPAIKAEPAPKPDAPSGRNGIL